MQNDLKFSGVNPVIINYNGSSDDIYAPIKTSSCDVNIVSEKLLDDMYSPNKDEVYMKVTKKEPKRVKVVKYRDSGSVVSTYSNYDIENAFTIFSNDLFFTDVNGDFRFNGRIEDSIGNVQPVTLKCNRNTGKWKNNQEWLLDYTDQYFYAGSDSYRVTYDGTSHYVQHWENGDWGTAAPYNRVDGSTVEDCAYWADNVIHYTDNSTEMLWGKNRYTWNSTDMQWEKAISYEDVDGGTYFAMYGENHMKVLTGGGSLVDAVIVNAYNNTSEDHIADNWVVRLNKNNNTFTRLMPLTVEYGNMDRVFTDDSGYVYYVSSDGFIYSWSWDIKDWVKWITFTGDMMANSLELDYFIPATHKKVIFKYKNTNNENQFFCLTNIEHPEVYIEWEIVPGEYNYYNLWEGYKMPNTYSQDVTLNLDEIQMTCIDPVSILKYVKIDQILSKPAILTYEQIIGKALAYVKLNCNTLKVERNVVYENGGLFTMKCQISNFWDESDSPSTLYEVIEEILRPFCLTLEFVDDCYWIFNQSRTSGTSEYDEYIIEDDGTMTACDGDEITNEDYVFDEGDWVSNNVSNATIEIGSTYDKVTAVASTSTPEFSKMVYDVVDYNQTDLYDILYMNVQKNKTKGYRLVSFNNITIDTSDAWYYIWNGVYTNEIYHLISHSYLVNGYLNINKAYEYLTGNTGNPNDYGSILNFYGGADNPQGTGKTQEQEKPVEIKKRITAYAPDNGTPLEFLELSDLDWDWSRTYDPESGYDTPDLNKINSSNSKYGTSIAMQDSDKITYHQEYEMYLNPLEEHTIDITLSQAYSRTGINTNIDIYQNNTATGTSFDLTWDEDEQKWRAHCYTANVNYFPGLWDSASVSVDTLYFDRYNTSGTLFRPIRLQPVWDKRRVNMYIELTGGGVLQYNGKDWVSAQAVDNNNSFYLMKMMNGERLYHTDFRYNIIETSDGEHYSLTGERFTYYTDEAGGVTSGSVSGGAAHNYEVYKSEANAWYQWVNGCDEGSLSIKMPAASDVNATIVVDVFNSTMLGMTGKSTTGGHNYSESIYYKVEGQGRYWDSEQQEYVWIQLRESNCTNYGAIEGIGSYILFVPYNSSYVKAEHLDLNISVSVPESNLGQMFSQSDIKYIIDKKKNYVEEFTGPTFQVNTYNNLVGSSYSYLIVDNGIADPGEFIINNIAVRPECYTVQAYMNWLSVIRKIYNKTLLPQKEGARQFSNFKTFITSPEVGDNKLMVIADSWDVKSDRHTVTAIEAQDLDVDTVSNFTVNEIPRKARAERWNLPTAKKKS